MGTPSASIPFHSQGAFDLSTGSFLLTYSTTGWLYLLPRTSVPSGRMMIPFSQRSPKSFPEKKVSAWKVMFALNVMNSPTPGYTEEDEVWKQSLYNIFCDEESASKLKLRNDYAWRSATKLGL